MRKQEELDDIKRCAENLLCKLDNTGVRSDLLVILAKLDAVHFHHVKRALSDTYALFESFVETLSDSL